MAGVTVFCVQAWIAVEAMGHWLFGSHRGLPKPGVRKVAEHGAERNLRLIKLKSRIQKAGGAITVNFKHVALFVFG